MKIRSGFVSNSSSSSFILYGARIRKENIDRLFDDGEQVEDFKDSGVVYVDQYDPNYYLGKTVKHFFSSGIFKLELDEIDETKKEEIRKEATGVLSSIGYEDPNLEFGFFVMIDTDS